MAKAAVRLDEEENLYFHMNYGYMWKKLNTAPYYVSGAGEIPKWIREPWLLPSYANLSKCLSISYVPSMNLVNKIVQFYNANIKPEIDTFAFLHEKLESSDNLRSTSSFANTEPYCGLFYCYYYAGIADRKEIYGAVMRIQKIHDDTAVQMVTGLSADMDMRGMQLHELFADKDITMEKYNDFRNRLELAKRRTTLYKGIVNLAPGVLTLQMQSEDRAGSIVFLRLPLIESVDNKYFGSVGLLTLISERDLQILKMGVVRGDEKALKPFSLEDENLPKILAIQKLENEHIQLAFQDSFLWNDMILSAAQG